MKTESLNYNTSRLQLEVHPVYIARFRHVKRNAQGAAEGVDYAFSRDFATDTVLAPTAPKLLYIADIDFQASSVTPEQGRATIGGGRLSIVDIGGEVLKYMSMPPLRLGAAMTDVSPGDAGTITLLSMPVGLPAVGTVEITTGGIIERIRYSAKDDALMTLTVATSGRAADATVAASHDIGDPVANGEQIRAGQRVELFAGYAERDEVDYMPFAKLEVLNRQMDATGTTWVIECFDIQRTLRRQVFLNADVTPVVFAGNPLTIYLRVLLSTGTGTNGPYDVLPEENGLATPQALVDVAGIEAVRDAEFSAESFSFTIKVPWVGKDFLEEQILKVCNCYGVSTQHGKLTVKRFKGG